MKKNKGFSLVELMIVITIIGVLTTIVLNSLSSSRARAYDTKVKQQLSSFRTAAEVYFSNQNPPGYNPEVAVCTAGMFADTSVANGSPGVYLSAANMPNFTQIVCGSTNSAYAVKATLFSGNQYWCVDSTGAARVIDDSIGGSVTVCP